MKSYTDLAQSEKLAEILPLESADMAYIWHATSDNPAFRFDDDMPPMVLKNVPIEDITADTLPCWSLAALIDVLPRVDIEKEIWFDDTYSYRVKAYIGDGYVGDWVDNPIDACYNMIITLNKDKLLYVQR